MPEYILYLIRFEVFCLLYMYKYCRRLGKLDKIHLTEMRKSVKLYCKKIEVPSPPTESGFRMFTPAVER
jgi:hypothetical protein